MNNFDLTKFLAEGKLYEAMSPQDVVDIADTVAEEFTKESADEGDFLVYSVGKMEGESFELDTDVSAQTPDSVDTRGVGEGWGGIFRIKPSADGYKVRNAEKGGLVATIDSSGNFRMLSAAEARAEMGMEEGKDEEMNENKPSNKMKKSELKEMIKSAFLGETEFGDALRKRAKEEDSDDAFDRIDKEPDTYPGKKTLDPDYIKETLSDTAFDMMEDVVAALGAEKAIEELVRAMSDDDALSYLEYIIRVNDINSDKKVDDIPGFEGTMDALDSLSIREEEEEDVEVNDEENVDVEVEDDVEVDVDKEETETDTEVKTELPGGNKEVTKTLGLLTKAQETARELGDEKLTDQIGNTITYFTRAHVARQQANEVKVNEVTFPMWSKINK